MNQTIPLTSLEMRWFFEGKSNQHKSLRHWFETMKCEHIPKEPDVGVPEWKPRINDQPDVYLLVPGGSDMGIKWREGQLQIKGCISSLGTQVFSGRHQGRVQRWIKWSYVKLPISYQQLFFSNKAHELMTVSVKKNRALRRLRLDTFTGEAREVGANTLINRGLGFELTDLEVDGKPYCSVAFEAFPGDTATDAVFTRTVEAFVDGLTVIDLNVSHSQSYPEFLYSLQPGLNMVD